MAIIKTSDTSRLVIGTFVKPCARASCSARLTLGASSAFNPLPPCGATSFDTIRISFKGLTGSLYYQCDHFMQSSAAAFRRKRRQCSEGGFAAGEEALTECRGAWEQGSETPLVCLFAAIYKRGQIRPELEQRGWVYIHHVARFVILHGDIRAQRVR